MARTTVEEKIEKLKKKTAQLIQEEKYEDSLNAISCLADILYEYNQSYTDSYLENQLELIRTKLNKVNNSIDSQNRDDKSVLFYDGFGLDMRGLALIYLKALTDSGYEMIYVVRENRRNEIPTILKLLEEHNARIVYIPDASLIEEYEYLYKLLRAKYPKACFIYTTPNDVSGIMAFSGCKDIFTRYQINLTDHAFWLGKQAFDYCIEFRDYGASISNYYRKIPKERIIKQPFYPFIDSNKEFEGFPFQKEENDFIIFSGGALYKTIDKEENLYYKLVDFCLRKFGYVKFWYAGLGDDTELRKLMLKYPGRVFHTGERRDLYQVLLNIDLYLNTYPMVGGLMMQYSAMAGKIPLTLCHGEDGSGILNNQNGLGIEFKDLNSIENEICKIIENKDYRLNKEGILSGAVISQEQFKDSLLQIILSHTSEFKIEYSKPDTRKFRKEYADRFGADGVERTMTKVRYIKFASLFPDMLLKGVWGRILKKRRGVYGKTV